MARTIFLKLGGSLITDKNRDLTPLPDVIARISAEIAEARKANPHIRLVIGHGSGSFGHSVALTYQTRKGVETSESWRGFAEVSLVAGQLNNIILDALWKAGVPAIRMQPSAALICVDGAIQSYETQPIKAALENRLVPLVFGDTAFDKVRGGTIVSTEEVFSALVPHIEPDYILLAGLTEGVYDDSGEVISGITRKSVHTLGTALGGSHGVDVTGGMSSKVEEMLQIVDQRPTLKVCIFSGIIEDNIRSIIIDPDSFDGGTWLTQ